MNRILAVISALAVSGGIALAPLSVLAEDARSSDEQAALSVLERYHKAVWVEKRTDEMADFMASDFVSHAATEAPPGPASVEAFLAAFFAAFPDLVSETHFNLVDGDRVVTAWTIRGTHQGQLFGMQATGKPIEVSGIDVLRVRDDKFVEHWFGLGLVMDQILAQVGAAE